MVYYKWNRLQFPAAYACRRVAKINRFIAKDTTEVECGASRCYYCRLVCSPFQLQLHFKC